MSMNIYMKQTINTVTKTLSYQERNTPIYINMRT